MFVITARSTVDNHRKFYAVDVDSGGTGYWSTILSGAKIFASFEEALSVRDTDPDFISPLQFMNLDYELPRLIYSGAGLSYTKAKAETLVISICEIRLEIKVTSTYHDLRTML